jgi:GDPmannose 4,6-dehydratase
MVIGITGQDGGYLTEWLVGRGYDVVGVTRDVAKARSSVPDELLTSVVFEQWDMLDSARATELVDAHRPDEAYNCAARASGVGMYDDPASMALTNGVAVAHLLEAIRTTGSRTRFCQASSSEMFGEPTTSPQSETTRFNPRSPYGAAKLYAHALIGVYRRVHGLHACSAILFNHESPRRPLHFVTRKISNGAARIALGLTTELRLGSMTAQRDWGYAGDYVRAMWAMLQQSEADDFVIATGVAHSVSDVCRVAFAHVGLDYRAHVKSDVSSYRNDERVQLVGDPRKANTQLSWVPAVEFEDLIRIMVDADLAALRVTLRDRNP